ncbi:MAG: AMP-binding protein, partial [Bacteroidia bacterium]|nr:AMP-binding protein [Bacteroidia bacterium]
KIAEDGEILCKGPNVMKGYYKRDDLTKEVIDEDGWFHTGDIGVLEDGKYLKITDRKKEIFKTSGGKYIAPLPLESKFKESLFIEQIMVVGEGQKFAAALIYPSFDNLKNWCEKNGVSYSSNEEVIKDEKVLSQFDSELEIYNAEFGNWETIKKFELVSDEWTPESGLLTPTLKLKRKVIMEKYKDLVDNIYSN